MKEDTQEQIVKRLRTKTYSSVKQLKKIMPKGIVKQFSTPRFWKSDNMPVLCQIKNCKEKMVWIAGDKKGNRIHLCFGHGEEL